MKVDVKALTVPTLFTAPKASYIPRLLRIRSVVFKTHCHQLATALRVLFNLCQDEYLNSGRALTHEAIQEIVTATADLAFQLRLPMVSLQDTKNRLSNEITWWNAWVDDEAGLGLGDGVVPVVAPQSREPHFVKLELERLDMKENALCEKHGGPDPRITRDIIAYRKFTMRPIERLFKALQSAGSKIDEKTFYEKIEPQIKWPKWRRR